MLMLRPATCSSYYPGTCSGSTLGAHHCVPERRDLRFLCSRPAYPHASVIAQLQVIGSGALYKIRIYTHAPVVTSQGRPYHQGSMAADAA
jgi:hypothetical protein